MKKKYLALILALVVVCSTAACGDEEAAVDDTAAVEAVDDTEEEAAEFALSDYLDLIQKDEDGVIEKLRSEMEQLQEKIGDSYEAYEAEQAAIDSWYAKVEDELNAFFPRLSEYNIAAYKQVAQRSELSVYTSWEEPMDAIYEGWYAITEEIYNEIYEMEEELFTTFDEAISPAYETLPLETVSATWTAMFERYTKNRDILYDTYNEGQDLVYDYHTGVELGFLDERDDIDVIIAEVDADRLAEDEKTIDVLIDTEESEEKGEIEEDSSIDPDFKKVVDNYEGFINEYVDFQKEFIAAEDKAPLMQKSDYYTMAYYQRSESLTKALSNGVGNEEIEYYTAAIERVNQKLAELQ